MTRYLTLIVAAATYLCFPAFAPAAFAHDGVHIVDPYARTTGGVGGNAAVFLVVENHQIADDQLLSVTSDAAKLVELHTHTEDANGVMTMGAVPEGFTIPANGEHALARGGDHVMMMGLTHELVDGDIITLTLIFKTAGAVTVEAVVDNARKEGMAMDHSAHGAAKVSP
ncbi:MAG: copper chaperone PCu(A)C [Microgenomates group bacterium]